ncbi:cation diffusion facilitator family transporter [Candidatus Palauibacter sp.]|uniref:cation diffusion facilitator family transporter n=1 Tax=Candidatus Palauibacter sp. TaxID=3101350 RepID=UPI003B022EF7
MPQSYPEASDAQDSLSASKQSLIAALVLIVGYMLAAVIGGYLAGSLALLAHAGHMLADAVSLALALGATRFVGQSASAERTYGLQRTEILAALVNALLLWGISIAVFFEAYRRFSGASEVQGELMLIVGAVGLVVNISALAILHGPAQTNTNVAGVLQHMMTDLLGAVAVVVAGVLVWAFGQHVADSALSVLIGIAILASTWRLLSGVVQVLLGSTPEHIDVYALCHQIEELEGVTTIHDVHCWAISPGYDALTAHLLVEPGYESDRRVEPLLDRIRDIAYDEFNIHHITIQVETRVGRCIESHHVDHLLATARNP